MVDYWLSSHIFIQFFTHKSQLISICSHFDDLRIVNRLYILILLALGTWLKLINEWITLISLFVIKNVFVKLIKFLFHGSEGIVIYVRNIVIQKWHSWHIRLLVIKLRAIIGLRFVIWPWFDLFLRVHVSQHAASDFISLSLLRLLLVPLMLHFIKYRIKLMLLLVLILW